MNQFLVDVALPLPLPRPFTYLVPPELQDRIRPGMRALVPFGKKKLTGIVTGFPKDSSLSTLKPIDDLLDPGPVISDELMALGKWMSEYYAAPYGEVLKAFLPLGISVENRTMISLKRPLLDEEIARLKRFAPKRAKLVSALSAGKELSVAQLQRRTGLKGIYSILSELSATGVVELAEELSKARVKPKLEKFVVKKSGTFGSIGNGKVQQRLVARISDLTDEPYPLRLLLKETGASLSSLQPFIKNDLLDVIQQQADREVTFLPDDHTVAVSPVQLTASQSDALGEIDAALRSDASKTFLLHGITGSGKTQVYIESIKAALGQGKSAIMLVPEISLTPQIVRRFRLHFGSAVAVMHSRMSDGERYDAWRFSREGKYKIVIGPRSALFAPLANLGLIAVDEEHESSYKQYDATPRYNARDVAIMRGNLTKAVIILGSATPSIESFENSESKKYRILQLPDRIDRAVLPSIRLINMADDHKVRYAALKVKAKEIGKKAFEGAFHSISVVLEEKIRDRLAKHEGIILMQNRRGFAPFIECMECGHVERCDQCDVTMTYHLAKKHLRCHYCGSVKPAPSVCPKCQGVQLKLQGFGTQRVEQDVASLFPEARVIRMDLDTTTRKDSHDRLLQQFGRGDADILLGTQMVAKGLDFPRVTLVGVISADTQMLLPDFRSAERTFQLLTQVAGRAGRSALKGEVIIQTYQPDHYTLKHVINHNYRGFYQEELRYRSSAVYPPFARLVLVEFKGEDERMVQRTAEKFSEELRRTSPQTVILGPAAAVISKIKNNYRWQIVVKAIKTNDPNAASVRNAITRVVQNFSANLPHHRDVKIIVDVDPQGIM